MSGDIMDRTCGNCKRWIRSFNNDGYCIYNGIAYMSLKTASCKNHEHKQENKMKIEQYIPREKIESGKKYPKWMAKVDYDGVINVVFVSDIGEHLCCAVEGCNQLLIRAGYETDFAVWGECGEFIRFKEGWY